LEEKSDEKTYGWCYLPKGYNLVNGKAEPIIIKRLTRLSFCKKCPIRDVPHIKCCFVPDNKLTISDVKAELEKIRAEMN
jgi:hypothetical protein